MDPSLALMEWKFWLVKASLSRFTTACFKKVLYKQTSNKQKTTTQHHSHPKHSKTNNNNKKTGNSGAVFLQAPHSNSDQPGSPGCLHFPGRCLWSPIQKKSYPSHAFANWMAFVVPEGQLNHFVNRTSSLQEYFLFGGRPVVPEFQE